MKKICLNISIFFFLGLAMVFSANTANAAITIESHSELVDAGHLQSEYVWMGQYATGPTESCEDSILVVSTLTGSGNQVSNVTFNDVGLTMLYTRSAGNPYNQIWYLKNPPTGSHIIKLYQNWGSATFQSMTICGVNQDNPFSSGITYQGYMDVGNLSTPVNVAGDGSLVIDFMSAWSNPGFTETSQTLLDTTNWGSGYQASGYSFQDQHDLINITATVSNYSSGLNWYYLSLNPALGEYCGNDICVAPETFGNCPQDCDPIVENLFFFYNPYLRNRLSTARINYLYDEASFTPYDYIKIYQRPTDDPLWGTSTLIATSSVIDYSEIGHQKENGSSYLTLNGTSTYTGLIYYDIVAHFASYWDPYLHATQPERDSQPWSLIVNWTTSNDIPLDSWTFATTTILGDDFNTRSMACSEDEWSATTTLGINPHLCGIKQWLLDIGIKPTYYIISKIGTFKTAIMGMFPFSLFQTIKDDWDSATNTLARVFIIKTAYAADSYSTSTGIFTSSTGDGYSIDIPDFLGSGTSSIPVFSKTSISNILGDTGFLIYYYICRFFIWALVLVFWWSLITDRSDKELL